MEKKFPQANIVLDVLQRCLLRVMEEADGSLNISNVEGDRDRANRPSCLLPGSHMAKGGDEGRGCTAEAFDGAVMGHEMENLTNDERRRRD